MKLEFQAIEIVNFKSFVGKHKLALAPIPGVHFIRGINSKRMGSNGAGKSTLWDALCWALYGRTVRKLRNPDVRPWQQAKRTRVSVHVSGHEVRRTAAPNSLSLDGKTVGQEQIDELIGLSFETFNHTILKGQGNPLFFDLDAKRKMELFVDVLNLDKWDQRAKVAGDRARVLQGERDKIEGLLSGLESRLYHLDGAIGLTRNSLDEWEADRQKRVAGFATEIKRLSAGVDKQQADYDSWVLRLDSAGMQLGLVEVDLMKVNSAYAELKEQFEQDCRGAFAKRDQVKALQTELDELTDVCPTCGQSLRGENREKHRKALRTKIRLLGKDTGTPDNSKVEKARSSVAALTGSYNEYAHRSKVARDKIDAILPMLERHKADLRIAKERGADEREDQNPHAFVLAQARKERRKLLADIEDEKAALATHDRRISRVKFWVKGFRDVRLYLVEEILQELEFTCNAGLEAVGLKGWAIHLAIEKETKAGTVQQGIDVRITSPNNGKRVRWESWSGGESQRLRLIGSMALSDVLLAHAGIETNLEILDEPSRGLSDTGIDDLVEYLHDRALDQGKSIFYVDHRIVESAKFASVCKVVKDRDGSFIET